jgi:hypothetical protein
MAVMVGSGAGTFECIPDRLHLSSNYREIISELLDENSIKQMLKLHEDRQTKK